MKRALSVIALTLLLGACGYFNSLYNARRQFAEAERAALSGQRSLAQQGYTSAIEKAAKSYRKYPRGRWSDDALYLIARSRFELNEYPAARAAALALLNATQDAAMRADAHAIAGASAYELGDNDAALLHLDSAGSRVSQRMRGRAQLWHARALRKAGRVEDAWAMLDQVPANDPFYAQVQLERIGFAIAQKDSARTAHAFAAALTHNDALQLMDSIADLALASIAAFGATATREMLNADLPDWQAAARDSLTLVRAELALRAGDTLTATTELMQLASRSAQNVANAARFKVAMTQLRAADELSDLREVRAILLPALAYERVPQLLRSMRLVEALLRQAQSSGQPASIFAAAEVARDELNAPRLARNLFVTFVDVAPQTPWAPKALLAAIALDPDAPEAQPLRTRLLDYATSPYAGGSVADGDAFAETEERLQRLLAAARTEGLQRADQLDVTVASAVATLDSLRIAARTDSTRAACGLMLDTLGIVGVRADSMRNACMRADTVKLAEYMTVDTMLWRAKTAADSAAVRRRANPRARIANDSIIR